MELNRLEIPESKIKQLKEKGFETIEDLANCLPSKYTYFEDPICVSEIKPFDEGRLVTIYGKFTSVVQKYKSVHAYLQDEKGKEIPIIWFNQPYIQKELYTDGRPYVVCGKISYDLYERSYVIIAPTVCTYKLEEFSPIMPVYPRVKGMSIDYFKKCIQNAISLVIAKKGGGDYLDAKLRKTFGVVDYKTFLVKAHAPQSQEDIEQAQKRNTVDTLFPFAFKMGAARNNYQYGCKFMLHTRKPIEDFISSLPFKLTDGQEQSILKLSEKAMNGERIDALVQGDVSCGKTVVAMALSALIAGNGYQTAIMCPTSVLAIQHYEKFKQMLKPLGIQTALYSGDMKAKEKKEIQAKVQSGEISVVVGTHALISSSLEFKNLLLTVVDEEHRFGVKQREILKNKGNEGIHNISMSATPIPRTLALTVYGENTEIINITTMPGGRKPVQTIVYSNEEKVYHSIYNQIQEGHQAYVVCPLIENSDSMTDVDSVESTYKKMTQWFKKYPEVKISVISGNMKQYEIQSAIDEFVNGKSNILISTTIVEVGVNVPNATVIMIKNAERFGLAQLHQMRGRVGRGDAQGYCVLLSKKKDSPRLQIMSETNDGFIIAQKDLELRGTGDVVGIKQSGVDKCITLMLQNAALYQKMCDEIDQIFKNPQKLSKYEKLFSEE